MSGVHLNTQRYYKPSAEKRNVIEGNCPTVKGGCDARFWPSNFTSWDLANWISKEKAYPILTLEIDRNETFDDLDGHLYWRHFNNKNIDFIEMLDGKKTKVIGQWVMDGAHGCRSEVHPVYVI